MINKYFQNDLILIKQKVHDQKILEKEIENLDKNNLWAFNLIKIENKTKKEIKMVI